MKNNEPKTVGERIKFLRQKKGESQKKLGEIIGLSQNSISKLEKGETQLTLENLASIVSHYNVSYDYICTGKDNVSILSLLEKYISLNYQPIKNGNDHLLYPLLHIDKGFFDYLIRTSRAKSEVFIPEKLRNLWIDHEIQIFNELNKNNTFTEKESIVPLPQQLIYPDDNKTDWDQSDLLREMNKLLLSNIKKNDNKGE